MSDAPQKTSPKYYMYQQDHQRWVIALTDDKGVIPNMQNAGAEVLELKKGGIARPYWVLSDAGFQSVRTLLNDVGYSEFNPKPQTADYRITPASAQERPHPAVSVQPTATQPVPVPKTYTIIEICNLIRRTIKQNYIDNLWIKGEITDLKIREQGVFFSLIECHSNNKKICLSASIWPETWRMIKAKFDREGIEIKDGTEIRAIGKLDFFLKSSQVSFVIADIDEKMAEGEFFKKKFEIEQKLTALGIHDTNKNLPMPILPLRLAVFSNNGAEGWNDFITCLNNSNYPFKIKLFTVNVQGRDLESSFLREFANLEQIGTHNYDLGVIVRGGGSVPDLDWFNNLKIAEYIARSPLKFIIGIGHENDRNVLDEIAHREKTPTAVAEMLIRKLDELNNFLVKASDYMRTQTTLKMHALQGALNSLAAECSTTVQKRRSDEEKQLEQLKAGLRLAVQNRFNEAKNLNLNAIAQIRSNVQQNLSDHHHILDNLATRLAQNCEKLTNENRFTLSTLTHQLQNISQTRIDKEFLALCHAAMLISERAQTQKTRAETELQTLSEKINLLSPAKLFERGFAAISLNDAPLTSIEAITTGDRVSIRLIDGKLGATVNTIERIPHGKDVS